MSHAASVRRFVCRACGHAQSTFDARCPRCFVHEALRSESAESSVARPAVAQPSSEVRSIETKSSPEPPRPRLVMARAPDPDLEHPAEELADVTSSAAESMTPIPLSEVPETTFVRDLTDLPPLDHVLGGGLVVGSVVVLGAEPGLGKSSLVMQAVAGLRHRVLYASGEESISQCADRARRIGAAVNKVLIVAETDVDVVLKHARKCRAQTLVVDSIQTLVCNDLGGAAGSPAQVRECTNRLVRFAKDTDTTVLIIGHVTNDGALAGPKTLKHLVDVVLEMEAGGRFEGNERIVRCSVKNRFGPSNLVGCFEITSKGLIPVDADGWNEAL